MLLFAWSECEARIRAEKEKTKEKKEQEMLIACDRPLQPVAALESTTSFYIYIYK